MANEPILRTCYVINGLGAGGAERSLVELLPRLTAAGIEMNVVCLRERKVGVESEVRALDCAVTVLERGDRVSWIRAFRRLLRRQRPHLVHTTLFDSHIVGRIGAAGSGIPVLSSLVNTPYDPVRRFDHRLNRLGFRAARALDGMTARHLTTHFHAITNAVRDAYVSTLGISAHRITVIARGRDADRLGEPGAARRSRVRQALGIAADAAVLINVGRQEYQKGQPLLLQAMAELATVRSDVVLLIAGREGNLTPELKRLHAELGLGERVRFLGFRSDVADLLAASDVFVFPSLFEGLGGAVIEAMALGLPVVASDIPALREVIEDGATGDLVTPGSVPALTRSLREMLTSPQRMAEMGSRGRKRFHEQYGIGASAERMTQLYERLVSAVGHRARAA